MAELKPPLTYEQQIERLKKVHNLTIENIDISIDILKRVNYYRLSGYGIGLKDSTQPEYYINGTSLESLYKLYCFDSRFKNLLIHIIEHIEIELRSQISYYLALKYGSESYMEASYFVSKTTKDQVDIHSKIISSFKIEVARQGNSPFVKHHIKQYDGRFPIWVAIELFSFGNLSSLYDIMKTDDQKEISKFYGVNPKQLESWILALVEVRNICAHYGRLYNMPLKQSPYLFKENHKYRGSKINKIFPVILTIKRILNNHPELWSSFYTELQALMEEYSDVILLSFMGFPRNWEEILKP